MRIKSGLKFCLVFSMLFSLIFTGQVYAGTPLVQFTRQPAAVQHVKPLQSNIIYYTIRNNTPSSLPLSFRLNPGTLTIFAPGTTCGRKIDARSSCDLAVLFNASDKSQQIKAQISVDFSGRAPLKGSVDYVVDPAIACTLLPLESYQSAFCQQQYQNYLQLTPGVVNVSNTNVVNGQTLGSMTGIYQQQGSSDSICYISCGLRQLNGAAPNQLTLFELASVTKTFTGSILGKKAYLGQINPSISVNPFLPSGSWLGQSYSLNTHEQPVTYQQLATFSGGVCYSDAPNVNTGDSITKQQSDFVHDINLLDPSQAPDCLGVNTPKYKAVYPGTELPTQNIYSNSSFGLLGQVMMSLDGYVNMDEPDFNGWMCQHVLTPLAMTHTNACLPNEAHAGTCAQTGSYCNTSAWMGAEYAHGYHVENAAYQCGNPFPFVPWAPAGALRSNAIDMVSYLKANLNIAASGASDVVNLLAGMQIAHQGNNYLPAPGGDVNPNIGSQSPLLGSQGYAWVCDPSSSDTKAICGKIGGHRNFRSFVGFSNAKRYGIVLLFNTGEAQTDGSVRQSEIPSPSEIGKSMIEAAEK